MEFTLYIISHVGMVISLVCLTVAIITFLLCRTIRNHNTYLHLHLCVCLFLAKILFLTGVDKTDNQVSYPSSCVPIQPHHLRICPCSSFTQLPLCYFPPQDLCMCCALFQYSFPSFSPS